MIRTTRRHHRRHLIYYLKILSAETGQLLGRLVDITPVGMMMIGETSFEPQQVIPVRLVLPTEGNETCYIDMLGETVWCHKDVNPDYYATGFQFLSPSPETAKAIENMVNTWGFQD